MLRGPRSTVPRMAVCMTILLAASVAHAQSTRIPIFPNRPAGVAVARWPLTVGAPFGVGVCKDISLLDLVDDNGNTVPSQITRAGGWEDGSVRWAHVNFTAEFSRRYFLVLGTQAVAEQARPDDIVLKETAHGITVETGGARYVFNNGGGCFDSISLDADKDGRFAESETIVHRGANAFQVIDNTRAQTTLRAHNLRIELRGRRRVVIRVEGNYAANDGKRNAAGVVYYHFFAGHSFVRISHKFIVTENTNDLWFRDISMQLPLALTGPIEATANPVRDDLNAAFRKTLKPGESMVMMQDEFPHFGFRDSHFTIFSAGAEAGARRRELHNGKACGNWADASSARFGLAVQLPRFVEEFPTAFQVSAHTLTVKLWASESGRELDYRTPSIVKDYLGHDWLPKNHKLMKLANTAHGTAKTHEIWLYPHAGRLTGRVISGFGATRKEIYAYVDPKWVARSLVMGPLHYKDTTRFPKAEAAISDYFDRSVLAGKKVFPTTGYLYYGM